MADYKYLIIGGGMTADAAVAGIREMDPAGSIGVIGAEAHPPYDRPPLSKGLWQGKDPDSIFRSSAKEGATLHLERDALELDPEGHRVRDDHGDEYTFEKLLIATGGTPRRLPFGGESVIYFRGFDDYKRLRALADRGGRFAVIGGGFIGSELAAALAMNDKEVLMTFPGEGIGGNVFPADLAANLNDYYRERGVEVHTGEEAVEVHKKGDGLLLKTRRKDDDSFQEYEVDGVVAGIGIRPNTALAEAAGLEVDDGIVVDASLRTNHRDIFAAGDVASCDHPVLGQRVRVEHEDNANSQGRLAGRAMAGQEARYDHIPLFYSDLFDLGYEAVGKLDPRLETVSDWQEPYRKGVVYYLESGRVRGVLLWNVWDQADEARKLLQGGPFTAEDLKGRLPA